MSGVSVRLGDRLFDSYCSGVNYTWHLMRSIVCDYAWNELYEGQKDEWIMRMDNPENLCSRVWVTPFEPVIELRYESYYEDTYHLSYYATFVIISDFDSFLSCCPDAVHSREDNGPTSLSLL